MEETSGAGDNDRKPVTWSQPPEIASSEEKPKDCVDVNQEQSGDIPDTTASRTNTGSSGLSIEIESAESVKIDSSASSDIVTTSVDSSDGKPTANHSKETQPLMSDKKTEAQPKSKPSSWAALFVNTPPHTCTTGGKVGHVTFPPHSVNYPSSKADSRDLVDVSAESQVVSVAEDPVAVSLASELYFGNLNS